jgi:hypothetical protein
MIEHLPTNQFGLKYQPSFIDKNNNSKDWVEAYILPLITYDATWDGEFTSCNAKVLNNILLNKRLPCTWLLF